MRISVNCSLSAVLPVFLLASCGGNHMVEWVHAKYPNGVEFIGIKKERNELPIYFSVRIQAQSGEISVSKECPLVFHWQGSAVPIASITPSVLQSWRLVNGAIGGEGPQNRDYAVEFQCSEAGIKEFYARYNWESSASCPFAIAPQKGAQPVVFPLTQDELVECFGPPTSVSFVWGK